MWILLIWCLIIPSFFILAPAPLNLNRAHLRVSVALSKPITGEFIGGFAAQSGRMALISFAGIRTLRQRRSLKRRFEKTTLTTYNRVE